MALLTLPDRVTRGCKPSGGGWDMSGSSENYSLTNSIIPQFLFSAIPSFPGGSCYGERTAILPLSREPSGGDLLRLPPRHLPPLTPSNCLLHRPIRRLTAILFRLPFRGGGLRPMRTRCRFLFHPSSMTHLSCQSRGENFKLYHYQIFGSGSACQIY